MLQCSFCCHFLILIFLFFQRTTDSPNIVCLTESDIEHITDNPEVSTSKLQAKRQDLKRASTIIQDLNSKKRLKSLSERTSLPTIAVDTKHEISQQHAVSSRGHRAQPKEDEFDIFAKSVANHLRAMPIQVSLECQGVITNYLIQQRLKAYKPSKVKRSSPDKSEILYPRTSVLNLGDSGHEDEICETIRAVSNRSDSGNDDENYETKFTVRSDDSDTESNPLLPV